MLSVCDNIVNIIRIFYNVKNNCTKLGDALLESSYIYINNDYTLFLSILLSNEIIYLECEYFQLILNLIHIVLHVIIHDFV